MIEQHSAAILRPEWVLPEGVNAFYTNRHHGSSLAPYDSFNLATHVGDDPMDVHCNRQMLPLSDQIAWLNQVHGSRCLPVNQDYFLPLEPAKADASFSKQQNVVCAVLTADCLPILIASKDATCVAAVHAGWRGLASGVLQNTLKALNCPSDNLSVWVGPHISQAHFQVGKDVKDAFVDNADAFVSDGLSGKFRCDLFAIVDAICSSMGISEVVNSNICTYTNYQDFYSHRHAQHSSQTTTGRFVSGIYLS
jgi:hypothetical protein